MEDFIIWVMMFLTTHAPPGHKTYIPEAVETKEEATERFEAVSRDLYDVLKEEPSLFRGPYAKTRTAAIVLSLAFNESGFRKDVDFGQGPLARGDHGGSWCFLQLHVGNGRTIPWNTAENRPAHRVCKENEVSTKGNPCDITTDVHPGWTGPELVADRKNCFRAGLRLARMSFAACGRLPVKDWLRAYASGSCDAGAPESEARMNLAMRWFSTHRPPDVDAKLFSPDDTEEKPAEKPVLVSLTSPE